MLDWLIEHWFIEAIIIIVGAVLAAFIACKVIECCEDKN